MATTVQTLANHTQANAEVYDRKLLERLTPELFFMKYAEKKPMPANSGDTISFRRYNSLAVSTTALTEGVVPDGVSFTITKVQGTVKEYGNWIKTTEFMESTALDKTTIELAAMLGENAGESIDTIVRDVIAAGSNVMYANGVASRAAVAAKITALDILKIRRSMKRNKVKEIDTPMGRGYVAFVHPDIALDLMQTEEWKAQNTYVNTKNLEEGILGKMYGIYFIEAVNAPKWASAGASSADVFGTLVIGKGAYGVPDIGGSASPKIIRKLAQNNGVEDPLNQFNTVAWKAKFTTVRLNELCIVRYESIATA